jgi:hypothetical protein
MGIIKTSFFWKFSRDGDYSSTYLSFIIDVPYSKLIKKDTKLIWVTNFQGLSKLLILLQDIELLNQIMKQRSAGLLKPAFVKVIKQCSYNPSNEYNERRVKENLVCGKAIMGKHNGLPIDWGFYNGESDKEIIELDVTSFRPIRNVSGKMGISSQSLGRGLLSCYREHEAFEINSSYWDLMPMHAHIPLIFNAMKSCNEEKTIQFVENVLL